MDDRKIKGLIQSVQYDLLPTLTGIKVNVDRCATIPIKDAQELAKCMGRIRRESEKAMKLIMAKAMVNLRFDGPVRRRKLETANFGRYFGGSSNILTGYDIYNGDKLVGYVCRLWGDLYLCKPPFTPSGNLGVDCITIQIPNTRRDMWEKWPDSEYLKMAGDTWIRNHFMELSEAEFFQK